MQLSFEQLTARDLPEIMSLWNDCFSKPYQVDEGMISDKLLNDSNLFSPATFVCRADGKTVGFAAFKITHNEMPEYDHTAWLSVLFVDKAYRRKGIGSALYLKGEAELKKAGITKMLIAGEVKNFFSGIPEPSSASKTFFSKLGFVLNDGEHYDLCADVSSINFDKLPVSINKSAEFITRPYMAQDNAALELFFDSEFPGRWKYEMHKYIRDGGNFNHLLLLCKADKVEGFCKIHVSKNSTGLGMNLGENWGGLGPIGISKDVRGTGLGNRILCDSLQHLKALGAKNVNIDWTILKDFYGQFGFKPWRTYLGAYKMVI